MAEKLSACELAEIAVQIEKNGMDYYFALAEKSDNPEMRLIFEYLAREEEKHIDIFKKVSDDSCDYQPKEVYPDEYFAYLRALAGQYIFTKEKAGRDIASKVKDYKEGIDLGIQFEKDSILFYEEMQKMVPEKDKSTVEKLILEEKKHLRKLCDLKGGCKE